MLIKFEEDIRVVGNKRLLSIQYTRSDSDDTRVKILWVASIKEKTIVVAEDLESLTNKLGVFVGRLKDAARREGYLLDEDGIRPLPLTKAEEQRSGVRIFLRQRLGGNKDLQSLEFQEKAPKWCAVVKHVHGQREVITANSLTELSFDLRILEERLKDTARVEGYLLDEDGIRPLAEETAHLQTFGEIAAQMKDLVKPMPVSRVHRTTTGEPLPEHPRTFHAIAADLAALVTDKQLQYGDSAGRAGKILEILYPDGIPVQQYDRALLVVRVLDKLSRLATHQQDAGGEEPWRDIAGYALLALEKGF